MRCLGAKLCLFAASLVLAGSADAQNATLGALTPSGFPTAPIYGAGLEQYNSFNGYMGASVPLHHIGGRGEAGFDLMWNLQPGWVATYNGIPGYNGIIFAEPYPSGNIYEGGNAFGLGGPGAVYLRTGFSWKTCPGGGYAADTSVTSVVFVMPNGGQLSLADSNTHGAAVTVPGNTCTSQPSARGMREGDISSAAPITARFSSLISTAPMSRNRRLIVMGMVLPPSAGRWCFPTG